APAEATLRFDCTQADALRLLNGWGGQPLPLNASRWMPADGGRVAGNSDDRAGSLWLRLRGAAAAVAAAGSHLGGERCDDAQARGEWDMARDLRLAPFVHLDGHDLWRLSVPQTAPVLALDGLLMIDWHGAQRWYLASPGEGECLRTAARQVGGHATLFRAAAPGGDRRFEKPDPASMTIHRALVREFDPDGVFDRARLYPDL
ncbi:MAG: glycolate oxidase subunit GlcE, partial [Gammaproteobacteria bacterium]|nr:glycolate oxidase subunit GlcE [Gammaproteobacteria bacterium]